MSNVNYSLKHKGVRLIDSSIAWVKGKNGKMKLNPKYSFVEKIETSMPNFIVTASDKKKPKYKGSTYDLNRVAKGQIIEHFYDERGKRNKRTVSYIFAETGDEYRSLGLIHKEKTFGKKNMPLEDNPQQGKMKSLIFATVLFQIRKIIIVIELLKICLFRKKTFQR